MLVIVDDVWDMAHLKPFLQGGSRCARLITTCDSRALPPGVTELPIDAMRDDESVALLTRGLSPHLSEHTRLSQLADRVGHWPLLLILVHAALQERMTLGQSLADTLSYVEKVLNRKGLQAFDMQNAGERNQAVNKTLALSLDLLQPEEQARYFDLAIFPEDFDIPFAIVAKLWEATGQFDDFQTEELCLRLERLSLVLRLDLAKQRIRLHDMLRTYLQEQRRSQLPALHAHLLDACRPSRWSELDPQLSYLYTNAAYHLHQAGRDRELKDLLLDFDWLEAKLRGTDMTSVVSDYEWVAEDAALQEVQGALRLSTLLAKDRSQLAPQVVGRLCRVRTKM